MSNENGMDNTVSSTDETSPPAGSVSELELAALVAQGLSAESGLTQLKGFKMDLSANPGFRKAHFAARCRCGTAALLSVEVAQDKTVSEVKRALPSLVGKLEAQAKSFYGMPCEAHEKMRLGPAARQ